MKEEPVDILDGRGSKTGRTMLKSEAHKEGLWHGAAHIWIYNSRGDVLMQLRSPKKVVRPNIWDVSVAGHIPAGQTPKETAVEEAAEEIGLRVDPAKLEFLAEGTINYRVDDWRHRVYLWIYALRQDNLKLDDLVLEEDETAAVRWIKIEQLKKELRDPAHAADYSNVMFSYNVAIDKIPKLLGEKG